MLENLVKQGLATLIKKSEGIYSLVLYVPKATKPVMGLLIPEIERIYLHDVWMEVTQFHYERTADKEELREEHERWKKSLKEKEKKKTIELEALKSIPNDKGFIIELWEGL